MKTIEKYVCEKCGAEYDDMNDAYNCEARPDPIEGQEIEVGQMIDFQKEDNGMGVRWSYSTGSGLVAHKNMALFTNQQTGEESHGYVFFVEMPMGGDMIERRLVQSDGQGGLISTAESYRGIDSLATSEIPEFHEKLKKEHDDVV